MLSKHMQEASHCVTWGIHIKALIRSEHSNILFCGPYPNELKTYIITETFRFIIISKA